jgi:hypothetical protein
MKRFDIDDEERKKDPFVDVGYGVVAFFKVLRTLIKIFGYFSLFIAIPQILTYSFFNGAESPGKENTMLSNTGASSS